jgi:hypothetical protein
VNKRMTLAIVLLLAISTAVFAQKDSKKKEKAPPKGTPVLWQEPTDIQSRNLLLGPGGEALKPNLSKITFVRDQMGGGFSINYRVTDGAGQTWVAKLGKEAQPETASSRLVWAVGYKTEINHLIPCVHIQGAPEPRYKVKRCEGDGFANVKFEARPKAVKRLEPWSWTNNAFTGTNEFQGMLVLMSLLNNWDLKDDNNRILYVPAGSNGQAELQYIISDLGATFGKTGGFLSHNRNAPEDFVKSKFVEGVQGNRVKFAYGGKNAGLFKNITVKQAKWIGSLLSKLSDQQIGDAFRAANYLPEEVDVLTRAVRARIDQLVGVQG